MTSTAPAYHPVAYGSGVPADVTGFVRSIRMPSTRTVRTLSALSSTDSVAVRSSPSPSTRLSSGVVPFSPDSASAAVHSTVTSPLYQPWSFGGVVAAPESVG